jgi:acyl-CoA reductase-like NAD-dependent aldehyde dehydrogenase
MTGRWMSYIGGEWVDNSAGETILVQDPATTEPIGEIARATAPDIDAGQIFVNEWFSPSIEAPFGGFKRSGFGREKGQAALSSHCQWKNVAIERKRS